MKRSGFFLLLFLFLGVLVFASGCSAAQKRVRKVQKRQTASVSRGISAKVRFRPDRKALLMSFSNFDKVGSVEYELVYNANGIEQGVAGAISKGDTETKELLFGTCSSGVCTYHTNITNARLSIKSTLEDGTVVLKPFRIRV